MVAIIAIVIGGLIVLGAVFSAVTSTIASALVHTDSRSLAVSGVSALDVDLSAGELVLIFDEGRTEAELEVTGTLGADAWTFAVEGDTLTVASPHRFFGPAWWFGGSGRAALHLPASLQDLDAKLGVSAGDLTATGEFGDLEVRLGAGAVTLDGTARQLDLGVSAGSADVTLADVRSADLRVSAGSVASHFAGAQPQSIMVDVSAGSVSLSVPDGDYDVRSDVSAGDFDSRIPATPGAASSIDVRISAGSVSLR
ncbi:MAG: DUF2807 domain-containing protein [Chloroflexota bacterium]|nr:DUF2807 domain-containing protein [Chloroflexota bacterium]